MENLVFHHLLKWKMIILPILNESLRPFSLEVWENLLLNFLNTDLENAKRKHKKQNKHIAYGKTSRNNGGD